MITPGAYLCVVIVTYVARAHCNEPALLIVEGAQHGTVLHFPEVVGDRPIGSTARVTLAETLMRGGGTGIAIEHIEWLSPFDAEY